MKKPVKNAIIVLLCLAFAAAAFSCAEKSGEAAMKLEKTSVSGNIYAYYLACYKQYWLTTLGKADNPEFWEAESGGVNNADRLTQISEEALKKRVASCSLFDSLGLKLTDDEYGAIDKMISAIDANGGENVIEEDEVFKALGLKKNDLKTVLVMDAKVGVLQDYLYGEHGVRKITDEEKEAYYQDNYYRFRLLYLMNGDFVRDENGNVVYNENGNAQITEISDKRYEEKLDIAKDVLAKVRAGDDITLYIDEYSEQLEKDDYKNGHYLCGVNEYGALLSGSVTKLKIGEAGLLDTKNGIYVIQRIPLDAGAWNNEENKAGNDFYNFETLVLEKEFDDYLKPYCDKVEINRDVTGKYKMEELPSTFMWQYIFG